MPDMLRNNRNHSKRVAKLISASKSQDTSILGGIWHWINGVASGVGHLLTGAIASLGRAILNHLQNIVAAFQEEIDAMGRIIFWWERMLWHTIQGWISRKIAAVRAYVKRETAYLIRLIYVSTRTVLALAYAAVAHERKERKDAVGRAEARARREIAALHGVIEREAASAYRADRSDRASLIIRLLDFAVLRNPAVRTLVKDIATGILDLLEIDDPILRILLGFLIKHVIDKLGVDKGVGVLVQDLLGPLLGKKKPQGLHDVILDLSQRMLASEKQWAQFFEDGGSQVEQAGKEWRNITSVVGTVAISVFVVQAVVAPEQWAREVNAVIGRPANDVAASAATLFKG